MPFRPEIVTEAGVLRISRKLEAFSVVVKNANKLHTLISKKRHSAEEKLNEIDNETSDA